MTLPDFLTDGPKTATLTIALAHGAGAPMDSEFMEVFAKRIAQQGHRCVRFEFPYMAERRATGKKRPPDRQPKLLETWATVIDHYGADKLVIGGKSMGGRMATMIADEANVRGVLALGYPFYGAGRADKPRIDHLKDLRTSTLICQGTRDTMGSQETVTALTLSDAISYHWSEDGDHSFKPRKKSGRTQEQNWTAALDAIEEFLSGLP
ncbi:MAG: alpha/beta fold hydrolase [Rhodospirillaceae bacterium]|nr:alpha/beta fold hydrolase [Rhodospirillaceae bacterium]MBT5242447.1 alpha/beta fold hydrolase [Rhodospirillaceae bacterium]MBT5565245.1 alpha/beta fold hydrolase [Rhodospirillaceae bacterium]MBT6091103.1 alpha/beta fold hydrolase [Rhodospirillaceae bacterium]